MEDETLLTESDSDEQEGADRVSGQTSPRYSRKFKMSCGFLIHKGGLFDCFLLYVWLI